MMLDFVRRLWIRDEYLNSKLSSFAQFVKYEQYEQFLDESHNATYGISCEYLLIKIARALLSPI